MLKVSKVSLAALAVVLASGMAPAMAQDVAKRHDAAKESLEAATNKVHRARLFSGLRAGLSVDETKKIKRLEDVTAKVEAADTLREKHRIVMDDVGEEFSQMADKVRHIREGQHSKQGLVRLEEPARKLNKMDAKVLEVRKANGGLPITHYLPEAETEITDATSFYARVAGKPGITEEDVISESFGKAIAKLEKELKAIKVVEDRVAAISKEADTVAQQLKDLPKKAKNFGDAWDLAGETTKLKTKLGELATLEEEAVTALERLKPLEAPRDVAASSLAELVRRLDERKAE